MQFGSGDWKQRSKAGCESHSVSLDAETESDLGQAAVKGGGSETRRSGRRGPG